MHIFGGPGQPPPVEGVFVSRPNRFLVIARVKDREVKVHCPNPGRLWEIFHPGRRLLLVPSAGESRSTNWSLAAAFYKDQIIPMNAAGSNRIARELIFPALFPDAREIRSEYTLPAASLAGISGEPGGTEKSRFDFFFRREGRPCLLEVKSCTLTEEGIAMFPDAPTLRGRRHVEELAALQRRGDWESHVLFVLHHRDTRSFIPNFYTDPDFALALRDLAPDLRLHAVSVSTDIRGEVSLVSPDLPVEFGPVSAAEGDRGFFLLVFRLEEPVELPDEGPGETNREGKTAPAGTVPPGWYIAVEEAPADLRRTLSRRLRKKRLPKSPLDRLLLRSSVLKGIEVYTEKDLAGAFAGDLRVLAEGKGGAPLPGDWGGAGERIAGGLSPLLFSYPAAPVFDEGFTRLLFLYRHRLALADR